jgi:Zn-dependent protease
VPHVRREPFGMVLVPLLSFFLSGWMIGWASAPYDPRWAYRFPKRAGLMALAGPASNLSLVLVAALVVRLGILFGLFEPPEFLTFAHIVAAPGGGLAEGLATLVSVLFSLNLILCVFNLLPLPPMDGSSVIQMAMPDQLARSFHQFLRQPMIGWIGILIAWRLFGGVFRPIHGFALGMLYPELVYR